jgi:hypothetical protein
MMNDWVLRFLLFFLLLEAAFFIVLDRAMVVSTLFTTMKQHCSSEFCERAISKDLSRKDFGKYSSVK